MPSLSHEATVLLFHNRPALAAELLEQALNLDLPAWTEARLESADLTQVVPTEYRADGLLVLSSDRPVFGVVEEIQLSVDDQKLYTWPLYVAAARAKLRCPVCLLVVALTPEVAAWAARPIALGPGGEQRPLVVGPDSVPVVTDAARARQDPELAVLSAMAHGRDEGDVGARIAQATVEALGGLDEELTLLYGDLVMASLGEAARKALAMIPQGYQFQSDLARHNQALGKVEGRAEGRVEGKAEGKAEDVLEVLDARGIDLTPAQRSVILSCTDVGQLQRWVRKAATVGFAQMLFEE
jgi:hypothetical protein